MTYGVSVPAAAQAAFNTLVSVYEGIFTTSVTVNLNVNFGNTDLGESDSDLKGVSYSAWRTAMIANASANPGNTYAVAAAASLPASDPVGLGNMFVNTANARALGLTANTAVDSTLVFSNSAVFEYNGVASANAADFLDVAAHELNEALGIGSALTGLEDGAPVPSDHYSPEDYFRYSTAGTRSVTTNPGASVYFSYNGGIAHVASFNQNYSALGDTDLDRNDWLYGNSGCPAATPHIQDAILCDGQTVAIGTGPEIIVLNALGYNSGASQTITFSLLSNVPRGVVQLGTAPFTLTASASSGLAVIFSSGTPAVCTVSGSSVATVAPGVCSITANQAGNASYLPAPSVTITFSVVTLPAVPTLLSPASGATGVSLTPTLNWNTSSGATSYDVYLGTTLVLITNLGANSYTPTALKPATTYYWQIVARNVVGTTSSAVWSFTTQTSAAQEIHAPDFNGDGKSDVYLYDPIGGNGFAGLSNGSGTFTYVSTPFTPGFDVVRYGSLNNDAFTDLIVYNSTTAIGYALLGTGTGTFNAISLFWGPGFKTVAAGDLNGDGYTDFVIYRPSDGTMYSAISNGDGTFHYQYTLVTIGFTNLQVADFNGDGKADVFFYRASDGVAFVGISNGTGGFTFSPVTVGGGYDFIETGDVNGDGKADLLFYSSSTGAAYIGTSTGSGFTFSPLVTSAGFTSVRMLDYNGDGFADIIFYNQNSTLGYLLIGNGAGSFTTSSLFWGAGMQLVEVGDLNGDGKPDVIFYDTTNAAAYTGLNTGNVSNPFTYTYSYWGTGRVVVTSAAQF